jgi:membrane-bound lytic murein transglycosylase D
MTATHRRLLALASLAVLGCASHSAQVNVPSVLEPQEHSPPAVEETSVEAAPGDTLPGVETVGSPLDTLAAEFPDLPDSSAARERERILAEEEPVVYNLPIDLNVRVLTFVDTYSGPRSEWFARTLRRSGRYLPMIRRIFSEEGVPTDLAYMAIVESAYRHNARSRAGAVGLWQFMRGTGRRYGLQCNSYVDERLSPEKSTRAAARYLRELYDVFGDWYLAMAAYNAGEGKVQRAIRRAGVRDFWALAKTQYLKRETRNYVPAILAAIVISKDPENFGFDVELEEPIEQEPVEIEGVTHVDVIAKCANVPPGAIRVLNPDLIGNQTPPGDDPYTVFVPAGTREEFQRNLAEIPPGDRMLYVRHVVRRGDTLSLLADRYGTTVGAIQRANEMGRRTTIREGHALLVPKTDREPDVAVATHAAEGERVDHRVRRGETLAKVARAYGTTVQALQVWNHIADPNEIREGQLLAVYAGVRNAAPANRTHSAMTPRPTLVERLRSSEPAPLTVHRVRRGESLWSIAQEYSMDVAELRRVNNLRRTSVIYPGQKLLVSAPIVSPNEPIVHMVARGETLWDIASRYRTTVRSIREWNGLDSDEKIIRPGDRLTVYPD